MLEKFSQFNAHLREFIARSSPCEIEFNDLALQLFALQYHSVPPFQRLCDARRSTPLNIRHWTEIPCVPTSAFKDLEITAIPPEQRTAVFHSSGTTEQRPSRHFHHPESLSIYEASLLPWFQRHLLGDWDDLAADEVVGPLDKPGCIFLTPSAGQVPHSSLVHMFETVAREYGSRDSFFAGRVEAGAWTLDVEKALFGIRKSMCANRPILILGTAFSFVHLLDHFAANNMRYRLAAGSRVLETGGYKGRSRELPKNELHALITRHLGISASHIVCEYGMSELSSQAYDHAVLYPGNAPATDPKRQPTRTFQFPPWARVQIVSPETGIQVADDATGLIRIFDLANVYSVMGVQTEDLGVRRGGAFELLGRARQSEPRGCSLMPAA